MKSTVALLALASFLPMIQATWCQFYYDSACKNAANAKSADCANMNLNGSGGGFVKCTGTAKSKQDCNIASVAQNSGIGQWQVTVPADGTCVATNTAGPWYQLWLADS